MIVQEDSALETAWTAAEAVETAVQPPEFNCHSQVAVALFNFLALFKIKGVKVQILAQEAQSTSMLLIK